MGYVGGAEGGCKDGMKGDKRGIIKIISAKHARTQRRCEEEARARN